MDGKVINFNKEGSSLNKGETLYDTLKTFDALGVDIAIIRHSDDSFIEALKDKVRFQIINAGAGKFEHPSQSLLDLFTIQSEFGILEGLTVTICGDIASSRVAKSNIQALTKVGCSINLAGPAELMPKKEDLTKNCRIVNLDDVIESSDVLMFLRIQHERHSTFELNIENYNKEYGLNQTRAKQMKKNAIIMHPGPVNHNIEIQTELIESPQSRIFKQKENGVYTRMAILEWLQNE